MYLTGVEQTSYTGSTGNLLLSDVAGAPSITHALGSTGTRLLAYQVLEYADARRTQPVKAEAGMGEVNLATKSLARLRADVTWNSTTYDSTSPTKVSFGTDGTRIRVRFGLAVDSLPRRPPFFSASSPSENSGLASAHAIITSDVFALEAAGREYYAPYLWPGGEATHACIAVTTALASSAVKGALYELGADGMPGQRLADLTAVGAWSGAATGIKAAVTSGLWLPSGWYVYGLIGSHAGPTLRAANTAILPSPFGTMSNGQPIGHFYRAGSYASGMPATGPTSSLTAVALVNVPALYLKPRN